MHARRPHSPPWLVALGVLILGGCVNLTPPWGNAIDDSGQGGQAPATGSSDAKGTGGGNGSEVATTGGNGDASDDDAMKTGGAGGGSDDDAAAAGGSGDGGGTATSDGGGTVPGGVDGSAPGGAGGLARDGAGGSTGTGGNSSTADAKPQADQALPRDATVAPDATIVPDSSEPDAPAVPDLPVDSATTILTQGLLAYYPCEQANGTTLPDMSGNGNHAVLAGTTSFTTGHTGNALVLTPTSTAGTDAGPSGGYATLPAGLLAGATEMTVATWFSITTAANFARIFDFGTSSDTSSMYLTPTYYASPNTWMRFRIRIAYDGGTSFDDLDKLPGDAGPNPGTTIAAGAWRHVAVVLDATGSGFLYLDGALIASNAAVKARLSDLGAMPNNWIGRSEFPSDPYWAGQIDEFRVYNRALAPEEIAALFNY